MNNNEPEPMTRIGTFRLADETFRRLEEIAAADERPISYIVRLAIEQYLNRRKSAA